MSAIKCGGLSVVAWVSVAASVAICVALWSVAVVTASPPQNLTPTYNQAIAPILFTNCVGCHRPGEAAPMSLLTYEGVRPWARAIRTRVLTGEMPPWPADPRFGQFSNAHRLSQSQIEALVAWVDAGAPEGDGVPPSPPVFVDGWNSQMGRPPDQIIEAPEFELPPNGDVPEFKLWTKDSLGRERFLEAIELRPTNRAVTHHSSVFRAKLPSGSRIGRGEVWPGGPVFDGVPVRRNGTSVPLTSPASIGTPLVFYVPAGGFIRFPEGVARRVQADDYLVWTFHMVTTGRVERTRALLGLWFSRKDVQREVITWKVTDSVMVNGKVLPNDDRGPQFPNIAPHQSEYEVTGLMRVTEPITVYALWPHMHWRGRDITFTLIDRDGREETLLRVPQYRFDWQFTYQLATPLKVSAGSVIRAVAHYDNSGVNRANPDPSSEVTWGPQANNEMFDPFVELSYDRRTLKKGGSGCDSAVDDKTNTGLFLPICP